MKICDADRWGRGWQKMTVKRDFFKKLPLLDLMENCFRSQRLDLFSYVFPFNLDFFYFFFSALSICKHNKNRISHPAPVLWLCMCLCPCVFVCVFSFFFHCDVMVVSSDGCLFGLLSLYLLSSSGGGVENPMVPCVCM